MKLIRVTCKDIETTVQDIVKEIDRKIPGLKWEEGVLGPEGVKKAVIETKLEFIYITLYVTVISKFGVDNKVNFSLHTTCYNLKAYNTKKRWTTTWKQASAQAGRFLNLFEMRIKGIKENFQAWGENVVVKEK